MMTDKERAAMDKLIFMLTEAHLDEIEKNHHGDGPEGCSYCEAIAEAQALLDGDPEPKPDHRMTDIYIYRADHDSELNHFHGRRGVARDEVVFHIRTTSICGEETNYATPAVPGSWAFGGTFLHTSNGIFPEFNKAIPLHDRNMSLEQKGMGD